MAIWSVISSLAQAANRYGTSKRRDVEQYNYLEGGYTDPKKVERGYAQGVVASPHKAWTDPDVQGVDKVLNIALPGLGGVISNITGGGKRYRERKEARMEEQQAKAHEILGRTPGYEIPQETMDILSATQEGSDRVREYSQEATDLAKEATESEMPGRDIMEEQVQAAQAQSTHNAVSQGGVESLGNIAEIHNKTNEALKGLSMKDLMHRNQAKKEYREALGERAKSEMAAVGLETTGLSEMAAKKDQQFQLEVLDPFYNKLQYDINQTGIQLAGGGAREGAGTGAIESIGMSVGGAFGSGALSTDKMGTAYRSGSEAGGQAAGSLMG